MEIKSIEVVLVEKWVRLKIKHPKFRNPFEVSVWTRDGKVNRDYKSGLATGFLRYFNEVPESTRKRDFEKIKKFVENHPEI